MITLKNDKEIALLDRASRIVLEVLEDLRAAVRPSSTPGLGERLRHSQLLGNISAMHPSVKPR